MKTYALSYDFPKPPTLVRFDSEADRDAYLAADPKSRRPIPAPVSPDGFHPGRWDGLAGEFRFAMIDDLIQP